MSLLYHSKGVVSQVRYKTLGSGKICEVKIETDGRVSGWLPMKSEASKNYSGNTDVSVGDQVVAHYFDEGLNDGYIATHLPSENNPLPATAGQGTISKNIGNISIEISGKTAKIRGINKLVIEAGNFKLDEAGNLIITGEITDKLGNLTNHKHSVKDHSEAVPR
jgi:phage baseplate assembly protein gpV